MDIVVGTAGHIDHGKTTLVKVLTGVNTDRLPEEKQRGITIDLGFAELNLGGIHAGFVDVPGHERFVKNMLAGASGIDLVLLVIAADEGVMPQTREHLDICRLLDIRNGIVVITKSDLVDAETLDLVELETLELVKGSFLESSPVIPISSKSGEGIVELRNSILSSARKVIERGTDAAMFLPIDRSFAVKGFGTVVTGTLASGELKMGTEIELLPSGKTVRIRGLQTHGAAVSEVRSGRRVAVNLGGIDHSDVVRGEVLAEPDVFRATQMINACVDLLESSKRPLRSRQRVRVHIGTSEVLARIRVLNEVDEIEPGNRDFVQLRLESPIAARFGDRFVIRTYSPQVTIGGGRVLDPVAEKVRKKELCRIRVMLTKLNGTAISKEEIVRILVDAVGRQGIKIQDLNAKTGWRKSVLDVAIDSAVRKRSIIRANETCISAMAFDQLKSKILDRIAGYHKQEPLSKGIAREGLRENGIAVAVFDAALNSLVSENKILLSGDTVSLAARKAGLTAEEQIVSGRITETLTNAGIQVPRLDEVIAGSISGTRITDVHARKLLRLQYESATVVKVSDEFTFSRTAIDDIVAKLREYAAKSDRTIDVPKFKELAGVSRKYAIPLLEYFDREKITVRTGDVRIIR